jgi:hypothetical protein
MRELKRLKILQKQLEAKAIEIDCVKTLQNQGTRKNISQGAGKANWSVTAKSGYWKIGNVLVNSIVSIRAWLLMDNRQPYQYKYQ